MSSIKTFNIETRRDNLGGKIDILDTLLIGIYDRLIGTLISVAAILTIMGKIFCVNTHYPRIIR